MTIYNYLRKELLFLLSSLLVIFSLASCQKQPDLQFGSTYTNDNNSANVVLVDTTTVLVSTTFIDSTATNGTGFLMVGDYNDTYFGKVTTRAYMQVTPPGLSSLPKLNNLNDHYDSISLLLFFKKGNPFYGDTTVPMTYGVSQVTDPYKLPTFQFAYNSNTELSTDPTPLGKRTVRIFPNLPNPNVTDGSGDTVKIKLDSTFGKRLYDMVYFQSDSVQVATAFQNWFHGLCIYHDSTTDPAGGVIYGFKDSAIMRVYYREAGLLSNEKFIDFTITNKSLQFNNVRGNYAGTPLQKIIKPTGYNQFPPATGSDILGNAGYLQSIGGLNVKLLFPNLNSIAHRPDYIGLLRATLTVRPVPGSFSNTWRLPPQIGIYSTDQRNEIISQIPAAGSASAQTGNLVLDYFHPLNTVYTYDVTTFIKAQITNTSVNAAQTGLLLSIPAPANTAAFNRLVLADGSYPKDQRITLSVYYIGLFPHL